MMMMIIRESIHAIANQNKQTKTIKATSESSSMRVLIPYPNQI